MACCASIGTACWTGVVPVRGCGTARGFCVLFPRCWAHQVRHLSHRCGKRASSSFAGSGGDGRRWAGDVTRGQRCGVTQLNLRCRSNLTSSRILTSQHQHPKPPTRHAQETLLSYLTAPSTTTSVYPAQTSSCPASTTLPRRTWRPHVSHDLAHVSPCAPHRTHTHPMCSGTCIARLTWRVGTRTM
jgi:hypothetical protein